MFETQQIAALAAGAQDRMWNFIETFYREQGAEDSNYVTESYLQGIAGQVPGLSLSQWMSERGDPQLAAQLAADQTAAKAAHLPLAAQLEEAAPWAERRPTMDRLAIYYGFSL